MSRAHPSYSSWDALGDLGSVLWLALPTLVYRFGMAFLVYKVLTRTGHDYALSAVLAGIVLLLLSGDRKG